MVDVAGARRQAAAAAAMATWVGGAAKAESPHRRERAEPSDTRDKTRANPARSTPNEFPPCALATMAGLARIPGRPTDTRGLGSPYEIASCLRNRSAP